MMFSVIQVITAFHSIKVLGISEDALGPLIVSVISLQYPPNIFGSMKRINYVD